MFRFLSYLVPVSVALPLILAGCADSPLSARNQQLPGTSSRYTVYSPAAGASIKVGDQQDILWVTSLPPTTYVALALCVDTVEMQSITSIAQNNGEYAWDVPSVASGANYRIKISSYSAPDTFNFSGLFSITSDYYGVISVSSPCCDSVWVRNSAHYIQWTSTGNIGSYLTLDLYEADSLAYSIDGSYYDNGSYYWSIPQVPTSSAYRVKVSSYYDPGVFGMSDSFTIVSGYTGTYSVTSPAAGDSLVAGGAYQIAWTTSGTLGSYVGLDLIRDTALVSQITTQSYDSSPYTWSVPQTTVSASNYRIKVYSYEDPAIFGISDTFAIGGMREDMYEPDNARDSAHPLDSFGIAQDRSLTYYDQDWISFTADSGKIYAFKTTGTAYTTLSLYYEMETYPRISENSYGQTAVIWYASGDTAGTYYLNIAPYSSSSDYLGDYTLNAYEFGPTDAAAFSSPVPAGTWSAGTSYNISWVVDTLLFGPTVELDLYDGDNFVMNITSYVSALTPYAWEIPGALPTKSTYRIRVTSYEYPEAYGMSQAFGISGVVPDSYEPDDSVSQAKTVAADGAVQSRSITMGDIDWIAFPAQAGMLYRISSSSLFSQEMYVYYPGLVNTVDGQSGTELFINWHADTTALMLVRMNASYATYGGAYTLAITEYDPSNSVDFINPTENATWAGGQYYTIQWSADTALFGSYVNLYLSDGIQTIATIASATTSAGTTTYGVPEGLETKTAYRIKVESYYEANMMGYSPAFTIQGIAGDGYEDDDLVTAAKAITVDGTPQNRTLSRYDADWLSFTAARSSLYVIETTDTLNTTLSLYATDQQTLLAQEDYGGQGYNAKMTWLCPTAGTYYLDVTATNYGSYGISVAEYDSADYRISVLTPVLAASYGIGDTITITWNSSIALDGALDIFLFNTAGVLSTIAANETNDGTYQWVVPLGIVSAADYRIKISNHDFSDAFGFSGNFSITP